MFPVTMLTNSCRNFAFQKTIKKLMALVFHLTETSEKIHFIGYNKAADFI